MPLVRTIFIVGLLACSALLFNVRSDAETILLATHESPPYSGNKLKNKGMITEIVTAAFDREGIKTKIVVVPWKRGLEGTKAGVYDGLFGCWYRKAREQWFIYSKPLIANEIIFVKRTGSGISFGGNYHSLGKYRIGYVRGYSYPPGIDAVKHLLAIETVADNLQNLEKLKRGRLDLVIIDRFLFRYFVKRAMADFGGALTEMGYLLARDPNHLVFSRKAENIQSKVNAFGRGLEYLKQNGMMEDIRKKHLAVNNGDMPPVPSPQSPWDR